jgi:hypothetical protein
MRTLNPNNLGKKYIVDQCVQINISNYLKQVRAGMKELIINSQLELEGLNIDLDTSKTNYKGLRYWFKCPMCNKRVGKLYKHPISHILGCRTCLNLEYRCRKYKGMIENSKQTKTSNTSE